MHTLLGHGSIRDVDEATQRGWMTENACDYILLRTCGRWRKPERVGFKGSTVFDPFSD